MTVSRIVLIRDHHSVAVWGMALTSQDLFALTVNINHKNTAATTSANKYKPVGGVCLIYVLRSRLNFTGNIVTIVSRIVLIRDRNSATGIS